MFLSTASQRTQEAEKVVDEVNQPLQAAEVKAAQFWNVEFLIFSFLAQLLDQMFMTSSSTALQLQAGLVCYEVLLRVV